MLNERHVVHHLLWITVCLALCVGPASSAEAMVARYKTRSVERWRPYATQVLKQKHLYSSFNIRLLMHDISIESDGGIIKSGKYLGILQMDSGWGTRKQRLNPRWQIYVWVRTLKQGGRRAIYKHWDNCHNCRRRGTYPRP